MTQLIWELCAYWRKGEFFDKQAEPAPNIKAACSRGFDEAIPSKPGLSRTIPRKWLISRV
jgi:hypothetical protein